MKSRKNKRSNLSYVPFFFLFFVTSSLRSIRLRFALSRADVKSSLYRFGSIKILLSNVYCFYFIMLYLKEITIFR